MGHIQILNIPGPVLAFFWPNPRATIQLILKKKNDKLVIHTTNIEFTPPQ